MEEKQTKIALRAIIWNLCFYGACLFGVFYLKNKIEIKNVDVTFVFLPLLFLAFSTESLRMKTYKKLTIPDLVIKISAYILSQLIFRRIATGACFWVCIICLFACFAFSLISSIVIYRKTE